MKKYKILLILSVGILALLVANYFRVWEYVGIKKNDLKVNLLQTEKLTIEWLGERDFSRKGYDTLLIYSNGKDVNTIPDNYGKNYIHAQYGKYHFENIGVLKFVAWHKHSYDLEIINQNPKPCIKWKIYNKYEIFQGICYPKDSIQ
jgi:hypothetical protein